VGVFCSYSTHFIVEMIFFHSLIAKWWEIVVCLSVHLTFFSLNVISSFKNIKFWPWAIFYILLYYFSYHHKSPSLNSKIWLQTSSPHKVSWYLNFYFTFCLKNDLLFGKYIHSPLGSLYCCYFLLVMGLCQNFWPGSGQFFVARVGSAIYGLGLNLENFP